MWGIVVYATGYFVLVSRDIAPHRTIAAGEPLPAIWPIETERLQPKMSPPCFLTLENQTRWKIWTLKDTVRTPARLDLIAVNRETSPVDPPLVTTTAALSAAVDTAAARSSGHM